jgi:hypothetical protein
MTCHACRGLLRPDDGAICPLCRAVLLAEREALNPEAGMGPAALLGRPPSGEALPVLGDAGVSASTGR